MTTHIPTRDEAWALLNEYNDDPSLIKHALAVEGVMRSMARKRGADEEQWGLIGLIHDLDYQRWPEEHCRHTGEILKQADWPDDMIRAVLSHGWGTCSDVKPETELEKTLFAIDELTGLISACALVRPSKSVMDLTTKSVKKKWKDKRFAAGADRDIIQQGADMLGTPLDGLIEDVIMGMREVAVAIGLADQPSVEQDPAL